MNGVDYDQWGYTYIRLGQRPYTQPAAPPNYAVATYIPSSNSTDCDDPAVDSWLKTKKEIYVRKMIIGYIFKRYTDNPENFHLTTVEAWDFGDYCIGDKEDDYKKHKLRASDNYLPAFQGVRLRAQLYARAMTQFKRYKQGRATPAPVPYMPSYTLNTFDSQKLGLGAPGEKSTPSSALSTTSVSPTTAEIPSNGCHSTLNGLSMPPTTPAQFGKPSTRSSNTMH